MNRLLFLFTFMLLTITGGAQSGFEFEAGKDKAVIPFQLINNLIFVPINVNGIELNFLLDTGVEETILLSLEDKEKINFHNVQKIKLRGLGSEESIEGLKSTNNQLSVNGLVDENHNLYIVLDQSFNFSSHVGIPINGIIGYHFFKDNLVEINYDRRKITVYRDNKQLRKRIAKKFTAIPITIERNKPYMIASVAVKDEPFSAKLLLDLGNSDALWLFENKSRGIKLPKRNFEDYLGKGFSGDVTGNRARILKLKMDKFEFSEPIIAFPDSTSTKSVTMVKDRAGSIGGEILRRFDVIFDYAHNSMFLRKSSNYNAKFDYNMSGIDLQNESMQFVQEAVPIQTTLLDNNFDANGETKQSSFRYKFTLKPVFTIASVRKDSPAAQCGLEKGDVIISINGTKGYNFTLQRINNMLKSEEGKWLYFEIDRNGMALKFAFQLKNIL